MIKEIIGISLVFVLLCTGMSVAMAASGELRVAMGVDASTLDPHFATDIPTESINKNIYNNLVRFNANMEIVPDLAEEWNVSEDGLTWTFKLREGVYFHDRTPVNAQAVKASFQRLLNPDTRSPRRSLHSDITAVKVIDEYTVAFTTEKPSGAFLARLAHPSAAILSPAAINKWGADFGQHPVGSGPFKFQSWTPGEEITLVRNEQYFRGAPAISRLVYKVVPDASVRSLMLQSGEVDVAVRIPSDQVPLLKARRDIEVVETPSTMTMYIAMNETKKPFDNVLVRKALNYGVNKQEIVDYVLNGLAQVADAPISPVIWGYHSTGTYEYNPEKARKLLAQAGYPNGFSTTIWTPVGRYQQDLEVVEAIQAQLAKIGVDVEVVTWEFGAYIAELKKGQFDMVLLGWGPSTGDADWGLYPVFHSTQWPPGSNRAHYASATADALLEAARVEPDQVKRREIYREVQKVIVEDAPWIFLWYTKQIVAHSSNVVGMEVIPLEHILFEGVSIKNH